jgi:hypothetical protein
MARNFPLFDPVLLKKTAVVTLSDNFSAVANSSICCKNRPDVAQT